MSEILFLAHRMPFPPDRGDKIRSHHILRALAALAPVHVATFAEDARDFAAEPELAALAQSYCLPRRSKPLPLAGAEAVLRGAPVSLTAFHSAALQSYVDDLLRSRPISAIYVFSGQMGQYVPDHFAGRVVLDFVDVDSAKFDDYAAKAGWPQRWLHGREARLLRAEEARLARRADLSLLISAQEAALFRARLAPEVLADCDVQVLRNGIDSSGFDPATVGPEAQLLAQPGPRLIFTGQMNYAPNVAAVIRAIDRILPLVRQHFPTASFHVVGREPVEELRRRDCVDGVRIWGEVADIRSWLKGADLALVPLEIARGVQNKVLEAMAMELPVVLSSGAATGIDGVDGKHFAVADSDGDLAARVCALLTDRAAALAMGQAARRYVVDQLSWPASLQPLGAMMGFGRSERDAA